MIKCKSEQVFTEKYNYVLAAGSNVLWFVKARTGEVILVRSLSIYNSSQANTAACYKLLKRRGITHRLNYVAAINAGVVQEWATPVYMIDGDEVGIEVTPNAAGDNIEVTIQGLRLRNDEYFKAT